MGIKRIVKKDINQDWVNSIKNDLNVNDFFAEILSSKGFSSGEEAMRFINEKKEISSSKTLIDMDKAVDRILLAIENKEIICIYGDYDADGVCSTALLLRYFRDIGVGTKAYIPKREDGYGLNKSALDLLKEQEVDLIITVDNGIVSFDEVDYANEIGIDVIITDHHQAMDRVPNAIAVVCPTRKDCPSTFKDLCGAGVAFKLIEGLENCGYETLFENYGELVAIATVGDIVPLVGENRSIVKYGLEKIKVTDNVGLTALIQILKLENEKITSTDIAFKIVPRLNAAGRMQKASTALRLLISEDYDEALELAKELESINTDRKQKEELIQIDVEKELAKNPKKLFDSVLVLAKEDWHHGVIGITASKISSKYSKPCFLLEKKENETSTGSGRGTKGISLFKLLVDSDDLLLKYGGHEFAAGLTIQTKNIDELAKKFNSYVSENCEEMPTYSIEVDKKVEAEELLVENIELLHHLEPFGEKNENIIFLLEGYTLDAITPMGSNKHLKCRVIKNGKSVSVLYFFQTKEDFLFKEGDVLDIVVKASINEYNGSKKVSVIESYTRLHNFDEEVYFKSRFIFDKIMRGEEVKKAEASFVLPTREDIGKLYKFLINEKSFTAKYDMLTQRVSPNYAKIRFSVMTLKDLSLIDVKRTLKGDIITVIKNPEKKDIDTSSILKKLKTLT